MTAPALTSANVGRVSALIAEARDVARHLGQAHETAAAALAASLADLSDSGAVPVGIANEYRVMALRLTQSLHAVAAIRARSPKA